MPHASHVAAKHTATWRHHVHHKAGTYCHSPPAIAVTPKLEFDSAASVQASQQAAQRLTLASSWGALVVVDRALSAVLYHGEFGNDLATSREWVALNPSGSCAARRPDEGGAQGTSDFGHSHTVAVAARACAAVAVLHITSYPIEIFTRLGPAGSCIQKGPCTYKGGSVQKPGRARKGTGSTITLCLPRELSFSLADATNTSARSTVVKKSPAMEQLNIESLTVFFLLKCGLCVCGVIDVVWGQIVVCSTLLRTALSVICHPYHLPGTTFH
jgi:hypothetical protein